MASKLNLDALDLKILKIIQGKGQKKLKDVAAQVNLSLSPTHDRIRKLEKEDISCPT